MVNLNCLNCDAIRLERAEHGTHVAGGVVIHHGKDDGVHEGNHVLGAVGGDAQQHVGAEHVEEKNEVEQTGNVDHGLWDGVYNMEQQKKIIAKRAFLFPYSLIYYFIIFIIFIVLR